MASSHPITDLFINQLFQHPTFQFQLQQSITFESRLKKQEANIPLNSVIEELASDLFGEFERVAQRAYREIKDEIFAIRTEMEKIKEVHVSQITKADYSSKEVSEEILFEDEQLFDLPSIKRTINNLQERVREINLNSSAFLDTSQLLRENKVKEDFIQERISLEVSKFEKNFTHQQGSLEENINKKIEKQQKTINNILQTLNELHPAPKQDKNMSLLTSSKSATKLKNFFGLG